MLDGFTVCKESSELALHTCMFQTFSGVCIQDTWQPAINVSRSPGVGLMGRIGNLRGRAGTVEGDVRGTH